MATVSTGALVVCNGFNLSDFFKTIEFSGEQDVLDCTVLGTTGGARIYSSGLATYSVKGDGYFAYNVTTDSKSLDKMFNDALTSSANNRITIAPVTFSAPGDLAYLYNTKIAKADIRNSNVGDLLMTSFEAKASLDASASVVAFGKGFMLASQSTSGTVNCSSFDNSATSTGYIANCHVTDQSSLSSMVVKIQHSTDNSTWADLITFTTFTANGSEQKYSTVTSVNRYVRAIVSSFSGTSAKFHVAMKAGFTG